MTYDSVILDRLFLNFQLLVAQKNMTCNVKLRSCDASLQISTMININYYYIILNKFVNINLDKSDILNLSTYLSALELFCNSL